MKTAVITGAGSGMGRAVSRAFAQQGYRVVLTDIGEAGLRGTVEACAEYRDRMHIHVLNVADALEVDRFGERMEAEYGALDVLINCAGVFRGGKLHETAIEDFDFQFGVNVKGIYLMMRRLLPLMMKAGEGAVVNISSISGMRGDYNAPLYCASKAAVINLTRCCALDYAEHGIRVNCVSPSATATPMFLSGTNDQVMNAFLNALPDHKLGLPEQVADAIVFLASDAAKHITGQNLPVDGGLTAWNGQPKQDKDA